MLFGHFKAAIMQQSYVGLLIAHMQLTVASPLLYATRAAAVLRGTGAGPRGLLRFGPEAVAALLLLSGLALGAIVGQYAFRETWLTAKLGAFVAYAIAGWRLGVPGIGPRQRRIALGVAVLAYLYAVTVALDQDALGGL